MSFQGVTDRGSIRMTIYFISLDEDDYKSKTKKYGHMNPINLEHFKST